VQGGIFHLGPLLRPQGRCVAIMVQQTQSIGWRSAVTLIHRAVPPLFQPDPRGMGPLIFLKSCPETRPRRAALI